MGSVWWVLRGFYEVGGIFHGLRCPFPIANHGISDVPFCGRCLPVAQQHNVKDRTKIMSCEDSDPACVNWESTWRLSS